MDAPMIRSDEARHGKPEPTGAISRGTGQGMADAWGELYREYAPAIYVFAEGRLLNP